MRKSEQSLRLREVIRELKSFYGVQSDMEVARAGIFALYEQMLFHRTREKQIKKKHEAEK